MRLQNLSTSNNVAQFAKWVFSIENRESNTMTIKDEDDNDWIKIQSELRIDGYNDDVMPLIDFVYDNITENYTNPSYLRDRAILTPLNDYVDEINDDILLMLSGQKKIYLNADIIVEMESNKNNQGILYTT